MFHHPDRDISTVMHGDDFTSLGTDADLTWMESQMSKSFELKLRGRLGRDLPGELRILNRIVRVNEHGLEYEADPRHVELIAESLELGGCKPVGTPGVKNHSPELEPQKNEDANNFSTEAIDGSATDGDICNLSDLYMALTSDNPCVAQMAAPTSLRSCLKRTPSSRRGLTISFDEQVSSHEVIAYCEIYGTLPFSIFPTSTGWKTVGPRANPYTGKSSEVMSARLAAKAKRHDRQEIDQFRNLMLRTINAKMDGQQVLEEPQRIRSFIEKVIAERKDPSEDNDLHYFPDLPSHEEPRFLGAVKGKAAAKFKKRLGAKQVKNFERDAASADGLLKPSAATTFRAVAARSNYLAQDRPDGTYSSKELCREFSRPNTLSLQKLKRLGRYYVGRPRLVYKYSFADEPTDTLDVFCDTDFAGCSQTRRSTSGGCALIGGRLVKHWSKTQPTIALSSGEAELVGIGQGIAQALGLQSLASDMAWPLKLRVHSDATAAIGITKRRGLGKVRHLHTADLWIQERVRNGDVDLVKVLGTENPADLFTKYLDASTMDAALARLNVEFMTGRPECAPAAMGIPGTSNGQAVSDNRPSIGGHISHP